MNGGGGGLSPLFISHSSLREGHIEYEMDMALPSCVLSRDWGIVHFSRRFEDCYRVTVILLSCITTSVDFTKDYTGMERVVEGAILFERA